MADRAGGPLWQLTLWRFREFMREPEAVFWVFAFPILLALALGIAFKNRSPGSLNVAVEASPDSAIAVALEQAPGLRAEVMGHDEARQRLRTGRVALVVVPGTPVTFVLDSTRSESRLARLLAAEAVQRAAGRRDPREIRDVPVLERGARYIDFLIPGLLGLNIMGTGMWGIGFGTVRTRNQKLLKRLLAAPMRKSHFLAAQVFARLAFLGLEVLAVLLFGALVFDVPVRGSAFVFALLVVLGAMAFAGMGLLVASRARTIEGVSGLMNVVMVPMWILSGVFFSWSNFPEKIQPVIRLLPLTALNDGLRAILLDGRGAAAVAGFAAILVVWTVLTFGLALKIFRWN